MYNGTGEKIKGFAKFCACCEIIFCISVGFVLFLFSFCEPFSNLPGWYCLLFLVASILIGVVGSVLSWLKYLFLAGYGELIEETAKTSAHLEDIKNILSKTQPKADELINTETVEEEK